MIAALREEHVQLACPLLRHLLEADHCSLGHLRLKLGQELGQAVWRMQIIGVTVCEVFRLAERAREHVVSHHTGVVRRGSHHGCCEGATLLSLDLQLQVRPVTAEGG